MRRLGPVQDVIRATINLGTNTTRSTETSSLWTRVWNERDVQIMVLISLTMQLFLLFTGNLRRRFRVSGWLKAFVWLAYLGSYAVAASAINLFSQYEDKYKLRKQESTEHLNTLTLPFLWPPFLLLHFGGPDTITAFSIEDNNLWMRDLINLFFQLSLAMYVFWKSFDLLDSQLLKVAVPLFVAGIIKYGERIWALQTGSHGGLDHVKKKKKRNQSPPTPVSPSDPVAYHALISALIGRRLLVGQSIDLLEDEDRSKLLYSGPFWPTTKEKLKGVLTELGMIYDMLYTKAMVLQCLTAGVFRCVALGAIMVAFVLFWVKEHLHAHKTTNAVITYALFVAAIFVEVYSIFMMIGSPWTRGRSIKGTFLSTILYWVSCKVSCCFPSQGVPYPSMGQFNLVYYSISKRSMPEFISNVLESLGMEKHWRNIWHVNNIEDKEIVDHIVGLLDLGRLPYNPNEQQPSGEQQLIIGEELREMLHLPFEHALFRLHIYTEFHVSTLSGGGSSGEMKKLVAECRKLSNYLMYLMTVHPSMLPVGSGAQDLEPKFAHQVRSADNTVRRLYLDGNGATRNPPFNEPPSVESLRGIKEVWVRLLIYAAGKCPMEQHARQLANGGVELLTVVGYIMMHQSLGVAGEEVGLLPIEEILEIYAFRFRGDTSIIQPLNLCKPPREVIRTEKIWRDTMKMATEFFLKMEQAGARQ